MSFTGYFQKITIGKKLLIKLSEEDYNKLSLIVTKKSTDKHYRSPLYTIQNDAGENMYFVNIKLDRYDINNMKKFERMVRKNVAIRYVLKPYCFTPEDREHQLSGMNFEMTKCVVLPGQEPEGSVSVTQASGASEVPRVQAITEEQCREHALKDCY